MTDLDHVGIVGAGAFGTALALVAHRAGRRVTLWGRNPAQMAAIRSAGENSAYLPGVAIPAGVRLTTELAELQSCDLLLLAVPAQATREAARALSLHVEAARMVVACAKGIEQATGRRQTEILAECLPDRPAAALSGPGFAEEIAAGLPTAVTVAAAEIARAEQVSAALSSETFRPYAADDLVGVELAGAVKNVLAIACGMVVGRGLGESARAALIARALAEMTRLGVALGARAETFAGLAGVGDLVLTATSARSRNLSFGLALARGADLAELTRSGGPLVEGFFTAGICAELARKHGVQTPIIESVAGILDGRLRIDGAMSALLSRPLRREAG